MADKIKRVEWLLSHIHKWDEAYFNDNKPLISDEEYDKYYFELDDLLKDLDVIKALGKRDMPLGVQSSYLDKVKHLVKVLSLDKIKIDGPKFQNQLKNFVKKYDTGQGWMIESKEDGLTLMNYKAKNSATFATRGQSDKGENVTNQLAFDTKLTQAIEATPEAMIIRGEGLINNKTFETIVATQDQTIANALTALEVVLEPEHVTVCNGYLLGESSKSDMTKVKSYYKSNKSVQKLISDFITVVDNKYASARNLASASLRTKDETMSSQNNVEFVAYDIINSFKFGLTTELECLEKLKELGYKVVIYKHVTTDELFEFFKDDTKANAWREREIYPIDGLVIKPNLKTENPEYTGHHQKNQIAIKFAPATADSVLRKVEWTIGNEGRMTPVAIFDTVTITGSNINRASLASWDKIQKLDLKIGDKIQVAKANDVIPDIKKVYTDYRDGSEIDIEMPEDAEFRETGNGKVGKVLYSTKYEMPLEDRLDKFAKVLKISSAKKTTFKKFIDHGLITGFYDFFALKDKYDELIAINGLGKKTIDKLLQEIEDSKTISYDKVILALAIPNLGKNATAQLAEQFETFDDFMKLKDNFELLDTSNMNYLAVNALKKLLKSDTIKKLQEIGYF